MLLALIVACGFDMVPAKDSLTDTGDAVSFGDLTLSPSNLDFGYVGVGSTGEQSLVITNTGETEVNLESASVNADVFVIAEAAAMPVEIGPGVDLTLTVSFAPDLEGNFAGTLSLGTDTEGTVEIDVAGTSIEGNTDDTGNPSGALLDVSRRSIQFGSIDVGKTLQEEVLLQNIGNEDVLLVNIISTESVFGWDKAVSLPYVLPAGTEKSILVTFAPTDEQVYGGTVTVKSDADNEPDIDITVDGEGFHGCTICAPQISVKYGGAATYGVTDFMSLLGMDDTKELQVWNEGDEPLVVTDITVTNEDFDPLGLGICTYANFQVSGFSGTWTIQPWSYEAIQVKFTGSGLCLHTGQLTVTSNDPYETTYSLVLEGTSLSQ